MQSEGGGHAARQAGSSIIAGAETKDTEQHKYGAGCDPAIRAGYPLDFLGSMQNARLS